MNFVSVVVPAYNAERTILDTLYSILNQTWTEIEVIVIDDGSTDETVKFINSIKDPRVKLHQLAMNRGVASARNTGLRCAKSKIVAFCDSDDLWHPRKIEMQLEAMDASDSPIITSYIDVFSDETGRAQIRKAPFEIYYADLKARNLVFLSSAIINRSKLAYEEFKEIFHEDYDFWLRNAREHEKTSSGPFAKCLPLPLCRYRIHERNLTKNKIYSLFKHFQVQRDNGFSQFEIIKYFWLNCCNRFVSKL